MHKKKEPYLYLIRLWLNQLTKLLTLFFIPFPLNQGSNNHPAYSLLLFPDDKSSHNQLKNNDGKISIGISGKIQGFFTYKYFISKIYVQYILHC